MQPLKLKEEWNERTLSPAITAQLQPLLNLQKLRTTSTPVGDSHLVLFSGQEGVGKKMTAASLSKLLGKDVYRIDLLVVVSKYISETEKNIDLIFKTAEDKNIILFFDEADALFSKRTDVKDAHDRYANQVANYLLQKVEEYGELVIVATKNRSNIDDAFIRRFRFIVQF